MKLKTEGDLLAMAKKLRGTEGLSAKLFSAAKRAIGGEAKAQVELGFRAGVAPGGKAWAPLKSPSKERGGEGSIPLNDTGRLRASFDYKWSAKTLTVGSAVVYAAPHQTGTQVMAARKMLPEGTEWDNDLQEAVDEAIKTVTDRAFKNLK